MGAQDVPGGGGGVSLLIQKVPAASNQQRSIYMYINVSIIYFIFYFFRLTFLYGLYILEHLRETCSVYICLW